MRPGGQSFAASLAGSRRCREEPVALTHCLLQNPRADAISFLSHPFPSGPCAHRATADNATRPVSTGRAGKVLRNSEPSCSVSGVN